MAAPADQPALRVVRLRPGLIFQRDSGTEIGRYFAGPLLPARLLRFHRIPVIPAHPALRVQAVHADDVADAYARALRSDVRGAAGLSWRLRLQPVDAGWVQLALDAPLMSCDRIAAELDWRPLVDAVTALTELIDGMAGRAYAPSPPLSADPDLPGRFGGLLRGRLPGSGDPY